MKIRVNLGTMDRVARLAIGLGCGYVLVLQPELLGRDVLLLGLLSVFGALNIWAAVVRSCPLYFALGIDTSTLES